MDEFEQRNWKKKQMTLAILSIKMRYAVKKKKMLS